MRSRSQPATFPDTSERRFSIPAFEAERADCVQAYLGQAMSSEPHKSIFANLTTYRELLQIDA